MESEVKEIAALLRSTDEMAAQFVERVQARIGEPMPEGEILAVMKKISAKSLTMQKVVTKAQQQRKSSSRRISRSRAVRSNGSVKTAAGAAKSTATVSAPASSTATTSAPADSRAKPKTVLEQLDFVLEGNWERAEAEGLSPKRMSAAAFVDAIYQYTDRREGTRQRILKAARRLDGDDVMLTPALVADTVHELFES